MKESHADPMHGSAGAPGPAAESPTYEVPPSDVPPSDLPPAEPRAGDAPGANPLQAAIRRAEAKRLDDYQLHSLARVSPIKACLGTINSNLMRIATRLGGLIEQSIEDGPGTTESIKKLTPAMDVHLRLTRQIDRFAALELMRDKLQPEEADADPTILAVAMEYANPTSE